ncbi:MAG: endonuclease MutS2 [Clostridia bacterium]|nr:endonuclease MutS2 [Clostridia bacterium]
MNDKALQVLEYNKIIEMLAQQCCSQITREKVRALRPSRKIRWINDELQGTDEAVQVILRKGTPPLGSFYDVSGLAHLAAKGGSLTPKQLLEISYNLTSARKTEHFLVTDELRPLSTIQGLASAISVLSRLEEEINRCIISEDEIADSASPELHRIRRSILRQNEAIRQKIQKMVGSAENQAFLQDAIVTMRQGRYVIPVKAEHKSRVSGIVHDQSSSGATLFIEPQAIVTMNNELRELELAEKQEILKILKELSESVGLSELAIKANQDILYKLDYLFAKGRLALSMNASRPAMNEDGYVKIRKGRHPLINPKKVVPIDVEIGGDYNTLVITGPNTGGKTVTLKTVGLLCLMAQAGMFVPAGDGTTLPVYDNIFADIGDEQSIEQSLSTFSSHMINIVDIVKHAGKGTLVLVDELGAGTDPTEGAALAMAILDTLYNKGVKSIATTHYTELKKYAISTPGVQNASMQFDVETLSPTYRLITGVPGKSNAFEISRKLGLPEGIIDEAKGLLETGDIAFEDVLTSIETDKQAAEGERIQAENLRREMAKQKERMEKLEEQLRARKEELLEEAKEEARGILDEARETVAQIQKEIEEARLDAEASAEHRLNRSIEEGKKRLKESKKKHAAKVRNTENPEPPDADEVQIGARVNVLSVSQKATVLTLPDAKGDFMVQVGSLKLSVNLKGVTLVQENVTEKQRKKTMYSRINLAKSMTVPLSINVVGQNLDDATLNVDKYLDDAFMAGLETVTIIHGRGAGILRDGLAQLFRHHKHVKEFHKGEYKEGGDGVTIVTIRR